MLKKINLIVVISVLFVFIINGISFAELPAPLGFKWGMTLNECKEKKLVRKRLTFLKKGIYCDLLYHKHLGDIKINHLTLGFNGKKLNYISLCFEELEGGEIKLLLDSLFFKYNSPFEIENLQNVYGHKIGIEYSWFLTEKNNNLCIVFIYNFAKDEGFLTYQFDTNDDLIKFKEKKNKKINNLKNDL